MTYKEIYNEELSNVDRIVLRKAGLFWQAFDRSAFLLHCRGKELQVMWFSSKANEQGVVRVGTSQSPEALAEELSLRILECSENRAVLDAGMSVSEAGYLGWRDGVVSRSTALVKRPAKGRRRIVEDAGMHAALAEAAERDARGGERDGERAPAPSVTDVSASAAEPWERDVVARLKALDLSVTTPVALMLFVSSLKEEISRHANGSGAL